MSEKRVSNETLGKVVVQVVKDLEKSLKTHEKAQTQHQTQVKEITDKAVVQLRQELDRLESFLTYEKPLDNKMESKAMSDEHIKLASAYGIDENTLTPINKITAKYLKMTYLFSGLFLGILITLIIYASRNLAYFSIIWNGVFGLITFILFVDTLYNYIKENSTYYILIRGAFNIFIWLLIHYAIGRIFEFNL